MRLATRRNRNHFSVQRKFLFRGLKANAGETETRNTITGKRQRDPHPSIGTSVSQTPCITQTSHRLLTPESVEISVPHLHLWGPMRVWAACSTCNRRTAADTVQTFTHS